MCNHSQEGTTRGDVREQKSIFVFRPLDSLGKASSSPKLPLPTNSEGMINHTYAGFSKFRVPAAFLSLLSNPSHPLQPAAVSLKLPAHPALPLLALLLRPRDLHDL